jgi:DNA replication protein DnaC
MNPQLQSKLKALRLPGLAQALEVRIQEAQASNLTHLELFELLIEDELAERKQRLIERRFKKAQLPAMKTMEDFDFGFNKDLNKKQFFELATLKFMRQNEDILFMGPPGVGKSHLAVALGICAIKAGLTVIYKSAFDFIAELKEAEAIGTHKVLIKTLKETQLLIIDDLGMKKMPEAAAEHFLEVIMKRYERSSTIITSNRPLEDWGKLLGDNAATSAILDRFLHHAHVIKIKGRSYRMRNQEALKRLDKEVKE